MDEKENKEVKVIPERLSGKASNKKQTPSKENTANESINTPVEEENVVAEAKAPARMYSFEQWAARNNVPSHHRGGMRAFIKNPKKLRTLEDWDSCFDNY